MRGTLVIYRREFAGLFATPLGWVLFALALVSNGFNFVDYLQRSGGDVNLSLAAILGRDGFFWFLNLLLPPLLTMRMVSEESRNGMLEFLLTAPVRDVAVITGKALAATSFMALLWLVLASYGVILALLGAAPDWGQLLGNLLGAVLASGLFCSLGIVASALTNTPLLSAFLAFVFSYALLRLRSIEPLLARLTGEDWSALLMAKLDVTRVLLQGPVMGTFDSAHVVFFLCWSAVLLFLATRILEARRWL